MAIVDLIESTRLTIQKRLDAAKAPAERNRLGQFATPTALADEILEYGRSLLRRSEKVCFLDPAFGTGAFYSALLRAFPPPRISHTTAYEIDPCVGEEAARLWSHTPLSLHISDFTRSTPPLAEGAKANLVICNPPYVRHHHLAADEKSRLRTSAERSSSIRVNGLAGLYVYFLLISHVWMAKNALAGWLIPSEWMDVNYGRDLKLYLLSRVTLLRVHRFDPADCQFPDALVSSTVVWFRNAMPPRDHCVEFSYGGTLSQPRSSVTVPVGTLRTSDKWTRFALSDNGNSDSHSTRLSDLFHIKRGIATGGNDFFVLTTYQARRLQIPGDFLRPILPSPRYLSEDEIPADADGSPIIDRRLCLLACDLPEHELEAKYPSVWEYLQTGVRKGISERYLSKHRSPWYSQESREPAPFLCTYMGRRGSADRRPFRFILNHSRAIAPNVYLMLYPKPSLARLLDANSDLARSVWKSLCSIPLEHLIQEGRVYGGGLHKLEPRELANAPADGVLACLSGAAGELGDQMSLFSLTAAP